MTNFTKLEPVPLPLNISSTTERRTYRQRNSADGKIFLSYREDIAVLNHFNRTLLKIGSIISVVGKSTVEIMEP
uniref:hypothetical protein n=1 Tax=Streptococcus suis TaxID=1307 RepID=UPI000B121796